MEYYAKSRWAYKLFHSKQGCMHFALTLDDYDGIFAQAHLVNKNIDEHTESILEVGCGNDANLKYLAKLNRGIDFYGIDLSKTEKVKSNNITTMHGDYHKLDMFDDNSMDIIFGVETLSYASDWNALLSELYRVLKPNGKLIVFDGYMSKTQDEMTESEKLAVKWTDNGMVVNRFCLLKEFEDIVANFKTTDGGYFKDKKTMDLTNGTEKNWKKFEKLADKYLNSKILTSIGKYVLSEVVINNIATGYLGGTLFDRGIYYYYMHTYTK